MTIEIERELKTLLHQAEYNKIMLNYSKISQLRQVNYYFDTPASQLSKNNIGLRVRVIPDEHKFIQTLKFSNSTKSSNRVLTEVSDRLTYQELAAILDQATPHTFTGSVGKYLATNFSNLDKNLNIVAQSETKRTLLSGPKSTIITLDRSTYDDGFTDFELEIEEANRDLLKQTFAALLKKFNITQASVENKHDRALKHGLKPLFF